MKSKKRLFQRLILLSVSFLTLSCSENKEPKIDPKEPGDIEEPINDDPPQQDEPINDDPPPEEPKPILRCNHNNEETYVTPSTCLTEGYKMHVCLTCGEFGKDEITAKTEHDFSYEYVTYPYQVDTFQFGPAFRNNLSFACKVCGKVKESKTFSLKDAEQYERGVAFVENGKKKALPYTGFEFEKWSNGSNENPLATYTSEITPVFKQIQREFPILNINLSDGVKITDVDRAEYKKASIEVKIPNKETANYSCDFKGRGNGSWGGGLNKSGYSIKLSKKDNFVGMKSKSKKWIIIPCNNDDTMHVNYTAYNLVKNVFKGIEWQNETKFVEVYVNNEYRGVYVLSDKITEESTRLNIKTENSDDEYDVNAENPGFLIEYDRYATREGQQSSNYYLDHEPTENYTYFRANNLYRPFSVKYPDPDDLKMFGGNIEDSDFNKVVLFIKGKINNFSRVLDSGTYEELCEIVDINSFIDMYLIHEYFKNSDVGWSSFYIYKKPNEDKLRFGPAWDFDLSTIYARDDKIDGKHISTKTFSGLPTSNVTANYNDMFVKATKLLDKNGNKAFADSLNKRFKELYPNIMKNVMQIVGGTDNSFETFIYNELRWHIGSGGYYAPALEKLYFWLIERAKWMINNNFVY